VGNSVLLIFIKNPVLGKVKTRLANTVGDHKALDIYKDLLVITRQNSQKVYAKRWLLYSDFIDENDDWSEVDFEKKLQSLGDLGQRMESAFQSAFENNASKVVIIGSDCPHLSPEIINDAFLQLDTHDFVLGPTLDGGYYLLGMKAMQADLFRDIPWSTSVVCAKTQEKIEKLLKTVVFLPFLNDIDTEIDYINYLLK
jgi:uncharacterized protein